MKKIILYVLYLWSGVVFLSGLNNWVNTFGIVRGSEFALQISILNSLGAVMIWLAIFGLWYTLPDGKDNKEKLDK